jgi:kynurenine formamidase
MQVIDLTHVISPEMPVYPGTEPPIFAPANSLEVDGFKETLITMYTHTGTHMDPPAHLAAEGRTLDKFDVAKFVGKGFVVDCQSFKAGEKIGIEYFKEKTKNAGDVDFFLFYTGWSKKWGSEEYFGDFPVIAPELVDEMARVKPKALGFDTISIEPIRDEALPMHHVVLPEEVLIIENLDNLDLLIGKDFMFCALPLKFKDGDGSPVRAIAICEL